MKGIYFVIIGMIMISTSIMAINTVPSCIEKYNSCITANQTGNQSNEVQCKIEYESCIGNNTQPSIINNDILPKSHGTSLLDQAIHKYGSRENAINILNSIKEIKSNHPNNEPKVFLWKNSNKIDICYKLNDTTYKITETINLK